MSALAALLLVRCIGDDEPEVPSDGAGGTSIDASAGQGGGPGAAGGTGPDMTEPDAALPGGDARPDTEDAAPGSPDAEVPNDAATVLDAASDAQAPTP